MVYLQLIVERACESSADQNVELRIFEKFPDPVPADVFTDAGVKDFNCAVVNRAANDADAFSISAGFISEAAQEFRALGRQGERHRNHCCFDGVSTTWTTKLFFSVVVGFGGVAGVVDSGLAPAMD